MQPEKTIGILSLPQKQINRQFYEMLVKAGAGDASAIKAIEDKIGDETTSNTILYRIKQLEEKEVAPSDDQS